MAVPLAQTEVIAIRARGADVHGAAGAEARDGAPAAVAARVAVQVHPPISDLAPVRDVHPQPRQEAWTGLSSLLLLERAESTELTADKMGKAVRWSLLVPDNERLRRSSICASASSLASLGTACCTAAPPWRAAYYRSYCRCVSVARISGAPITIVQVSRPL